MLNLIYAEIYKLRKGKAIKIAFLIALASAITLMILSNMLAKGKFEISDLVTASSFTEIMILSLLSALMIGMLVCNDFETKTIHDAIACGNGRKNIIISKVISFVLTMLFIALPYIITTIICYCMDIKFSGGFATSTFLNILVGKGAVTASAIGKIIVISLVQVLLFSARMTILLPIAFKVKNPVVITALGFALSGIIDFIVSFTSDISFLDKVLSFTPFYRDYLLISMDTEVNMLIKSAIYSVVFIIIMLVITYRVFRKAEIK